MDNMHPIETDALLEQAIAAAGEWETPLGKKRKGKAQLAFESLKNGKIEIGHPQVYTQRLKSKDFEDRRIELSPEIKKSMAGKMIKQGR